MLPFPLSPLGRWAAEMLCDRMSLYPSLGLKFALLNDLNARRPAQASQLTTHWHIRIIDTIVLLLENQYLYTIL